MVFTGNRALHIFPRIASSSRADSYSQDSLKNTSSSQVGNKNPQSSQPQEPHHNVGRDTAMMSALVLVSRFTGFFRTWAQAFALGTTLLSSCYTVANNLPSQLYELVLGGLILTAFLPVYLSVKKKSGQKQANEYVSNLLSIVFIVMGITTIICFIFASQLVFLQSAGTPQNEMDQAVYLFRFFAAEVLLYCLSSIVSGVLNAERAYFWPAAAPIFNNLITILSFILFAVFEKSHFSLAILLLAIGNPLGVLIQVIIQYPSLHKRGIRFHWRISWRDPALKETMKIGIPTIIITVCTFVTVSVMNSYALIALPDQGSAVQYYARLWYTLPYSVLAIPITTALFTEMARYYAEGNLSKYLEIFAKGAGQILFMLIPFMMYLIVFSEPLMKLLRLGAFTQQSVEWTAFYLRYLALALPLFGLSAFFQKVFSSLRRMGHYTAGVIVSSIIQIVFTVLTVKSLGIAAVALGSVLSFLVVDAYGFFLIWKFHREDNIVWHLKSIAASAGWGTLLGFIGAGVGGGIMEVLWHFLHLRQHSVFFTLIALIFTGIIAIVCTFGTGIAIGLPQTAMVRRILRDKLHIKAAWLKDENSIYNPHHSLENPEYPYMHKSPSLDWLDKPRAPRIVASSGATFIDRSMMAGMGNGLIAPELTSISDDIHSSDDRVSKDPGLFSGLEDNDRDNRQRFKDFDKSVEDRQKEYLWENPSVKENHQKKRNTLESCDDFENIAQFERSDKSELLTPPAPAEVSEHVKSSHISHSLEGSTHFVEEESVQLQETPLQAAPSSLRRPRVIRSRTVSPRSQTSPRSQQEQEKK